MTHICARSVEVFAREHDPRHPCRRVTHPSLTRLLGDYTERWGDPKFARKGSQGTFNGRGKSLVD